MRFATFNVLHGRPIVGGRPRPFPSAAGGPLAEAVAELDADVLALQEVDRFQDRSGRTDQAAVAAAAMGAVDWRYAAALCGHQAAGGGWEPDPAAPALSVGGPGEDTVWGDRPSHGIALVTRLPVRTWWARRLPGARVSVPLRVPGRAGLIAVRDQPRAALAAVLEGERGLFTVVAVHLSFVPGWNMGQLVALRRWISGLPRPHVLLGDFNLVGAMPRMVLRGASAADGITGRARRGDGSSRSSRAFRGHRPAGGAEWPAVRAVATAGGPRRHTSPAGGPGGAGGVEAFAGPPAAVGVPAGVSAGLVPGGWRDLACAATYPAHRPIVQLDHVLASGVGPGAVASVDVPAMPISDHRPLLVELAL